jgi:hypothetical protein
MVRKFATGDPGLRYLGKAIEESLSIRVAIDLLSAATGEVERLGKNLGGDGEPVVRDFIIACACGVRVPFAGGLGYLRLRGGSATDSPDRSPRGGADG